MIEVKPLALTVAALILMEAHIIALAIKAVQMLSGVHTSLFLSVTPH